MAEQLALFPGAPDAQPGAVRLRCVREGSRLRVRVVSAPFPFDSALNCAFPKGLRQDGREYFVPQVTAGRRHYRTGPPRHIVVATPDEARGRV